MVDVTLVTIQNLQEFDESTESNSMVLRTNE